MPLLHLALLLLAEDWPEFRGPTGQGHSAAKGLALEWSETRNITWKVAIPGAGWSSPAIAQEHLWLTTSEEEGKSLRLLKLEIASGKIVQNVEVFKLVEPGSIHGKNTHASPTPLIDGDRVFVHFGSHGTAAVSTEGKILWRRRFAYQHVHGPGNSPILAGGYLFLNCDGSDQQFAMALDKETGEVKWRKDRPSNMAFATPLAVKDGDREIVVSPGAHRTIAYDAASGEPLWSVSYGDGFSNVPRPVAGHGMVYVCSGFYTPELIAVKLGGKGDVTETHVAWRINGAPLTPSPILVGDEIYFVNDRGVAVSADAKTGKVHWKERIGGNHSASPLYAEDRIYFLSEEGETTVIAPGKEVKVLAKSQMDGRFLASFAVSGKALFARSDDQLYRIEVR